jgi:diguanylate cyclase (GGDEF)-like protein
VLERSNTEMKVLNGLADMLQSCATSDEAYSVVTQSCAELFADFAGSISIIHSSRDVVEERASWGEPMRGLRFTPNECWALRRGRPHFSGLAGPRCAHLSASPDQRCLCVPLVGQSEAIGVIHFALSATEVDPALAALLEGEPVRQLATTVAGQLSMAFANLRLRDSLREMSIRDPLTGLFNRRYMEETLNREVSLATRNQTQVGVVVIDVDHFKAFNDTHGHNAGDAILEAVGGALVAHSRPSDIACRFGGEEFIMIFPDCSLTDTQQRIEELRCVVSSLRVPYRRIELSGPTISCGIASFPQHGTTPDELIRLADVALYAAKEGGRNRVETTPGHPAGTP